MGWTKVKTRSKLETRTVATRERIAARSREARGSLIEIDMDKACSECGAKGAASNGRCLKCIGKARRDETAHRPD